MASSRRDTDPHSGPPTVSVRLSSTPVEGTRRHSTTDEPPGTSASPTPLISTPLTTTPQAASTNEDATPAARPSGETRPSGEARLSGEAGDNRHTLHSTWTATERTHAGSTTLDHTQRSLPQIDRDPNTPPSFDGRFRAIESQLDQMEARLRLLEKRQGRALSDNRAGLLWGLGLMALAILWMVLKKVV